MDSDNNYFTINPMSHRMETLEPGEAYTGSVTIVNPATASEDFYYSTRVAPYGVKGENYSADLITETNYTRIADWITIDEPTGSIKPNESKVVNYTIEVPKNAPAGGQYAAIIVSKNPEKTEESGSSVAVKDTYEIASLIYADIDGKTTHDGEIIENTIPGFTTSPLITVGAMLSNTGNVHEYATIIIGATNIFTGEVITDPNNETNRYTELIMPESERYVQRDINENLPQLGFVHVEQTIYYNDQVSTEARDVIICPVWFLILILFVIAMLVSTIAKMIVRHRKK